MRGDGLLLRDIHASRPPPWWPPAPGVWIVFAVVALLVALVVAWWLHRHRRHRRIERLFDDAVARADSPAQQVAAMSELLRRAARRRDPAAGGLRGEAWLRFLDAGAAASLFSGDTGALLCDGGYRREVDAEGVSTLRAAARTRFVEWMTARR